MKTPKTEIAEAGVRTPSFKGYTIEEIRYQRAMTALRKEFCKAKLSESISNLRGSSSPGSRRVNAPAASKLAIAGRLASKLFSNLNTLDYILMGVSLFGTAKKGIKLLKGRK